MAMSSSEATTVSLSPLFTHFITATNTLFYLKVIFISAA